jgi:ABC-type dipeptide/oligopeptide/nickel transport system permease component
MKKQTDTKQILRFSIHQTSKVFAVIYFLLTAVFAIPIGIYLLVTSGDWVDGLFTFALPFIYALVAYIMIAISCFIYNLIANSFGGIEFTLSDD